MSLLKQKFKPIIGITVGDVAGVGPEIIQKALKESCIHRICFPVIIGDLKTHYPRFSAKAGEYAMQCVRDAVSMAMTGNIHAIVTAPICKEGIYKAGYRFEGHTDYLAYLTDTKEYSMMLVSPQMRVLLVTIHTGLGNVSKKITKESVLRAIRHADYATKLLGVKKPRVAVCALNPHGSETGDEEEKNIIPAIKKARGINVCGPFASDTLFCKVLKNEFDVVVAMYHDQGLIPLKMLGFSEGVNITVGLPIIRTSPDHGTAYDIAGKNKADPTSIIRAIELAVRMANEKENF
jgi:4-hydroxythreonine-4-phosphate dehydrogenase